MLNKPVERVVYGADGKVEGIESEGVVAKGKMVICDPSYVADTKKRLVGKVVRAICLLNAPIPSTGDVPACQIIIPQRHLKRRSDIFVLMVSSAHCVVPQGRYLAIVSTTVETSTPELEIRPALDLLGPIVDMFTQVQDLYEPVDNGSQDNVFVSKSYDATSHFESVADDVLDLYTRITGEALDLTIPADLEA